MANDMSPGDTEARFELTRFLEGHTCAWGIFEDRFGRVRRRFNVDMHGRWHGARFHLDERFVYDDGRIENRTWIVTPLADGHFKATCADCIGEARGECAGDAIRMRYTFRLQLPSRVITVDFDDRLYRMSSDTAVNRATMRKWGVKLGELSLFFTRQVPSPNPTPAA